MAVRLSPPDSTRIRSSRSLRRDQVVDGVEVGGDVVADRGVRAAAGLHRGDPLVGQHGVAAQEVGVLGGVDVVGQHRQRQFVAQLPAQRGDQRGLAGADRPAEPMRSGSPGVAVRLGRSVCAWGSPSRKCGGMEGSSLSGDEQGTLALGCAAGPARRAAGRTGRPVPCTPRRRSGHTASTARRSAPQRRRGRGPAAAARPSPNRSSSCRRPTARSARVSVRRPRRRRPPRRRGAVWRRAGPNPASGQTRRASRTSPRPCARDACGRREPVCGHRFRDRRLES